MTKKIQLAHGAGGKQMHSLIDDFILKIIGSSGSGLKDAEIIEGLGNYDIAMTTDSYVVKPITFSGGDIGKLCIAGTVNDLIVSGAKPISLSLGLILEEGLEFEELERILLSIKKTADLAGVKIITGDTKVVERTAADKIYINTTGIGILKWSYRQKYSNILAGDKIILNGTAGDHGTAVMVARGEFEIDSEIGSDVYPLNNLIESILDNDFNIKFIRDCTRGGIATTLNEIALNSNLGLKIYQESIPIKSEVRAVCEILGLDPLYVANEGKVIIIISPDQADALLEFIKDFEEAKDSRIIGEVNKDYPKKVIMETEIGGTRIVDMPSGELLPRIC
ncbi:hydrogenase expression/formation protein HypE [Candidatus Dependentiae bacterium]|nr:hydrogenase expression/formation protein HypE [Candidatus Dependentiae bacterium]